MEQIVHPFVCEARAHRSDYECSKGSAVITKHRLKEHGSTVSQKDTIQNCMSVYKWTWAQGQASAQTQRKKR